MTDLQRVTVLAGGVGGARFIRGLLAHLREVFPGENGGSRVAVTVVVNTGDDMTLNGLRVCPDLDTVMYTLGGGISEEQGWGRADESRRVSAEISALDGVSSVKAVASTGEVTVVSAAPLDETAVRAAVDEAGFELAGTV